MSFCLKAARMFMITIGIVVLAACGGGDQQAQPLSLTIAHINDTQLSKIASVFIMDCRLKGWISVTTAG